MDNLVEQRLEELVALPIGLKPTVSYDGKIIYGSDKLNQRFIDGISNTKFKGIAPILQKGIEKKKIFPGFYSKGLFDYFKRKYLGSDIRKGILAFFAQDANIIVILFDYNIKWGKADNTWMGSIAVHEGMHMFAYNQPSQFFGIFKEELIKYYYTIFKYIFKLKEKPETMNEIPKNIFYKIEKGKMQHGNLNSIYKWYLNMLDKEVRPFSKLNDKEWEDISNTYVLALKLYWEKPQLLLSNATKFSPILFSLRLAYNDIYRKTLLTSNFYVQEIGTPSEVIAIRSEIKSDSKIIKAFNQIV
jgi:hypothetical protein